MKNHKAELNKYRQQARHFYGSRLPECLALCFGTLVIGGACIIVGGFGIPLLLISICFVLVPWLFSMQKSIYSMREGAPLANRMTFFYFGLYYREYFGVYRLMFHSLVTIAIFAGASIIVTPILTQIFLHVSPDFASAYSALEQAMAAGDTNSMMEIVSTNQAFLLFYGSALSVAFLFASYFAVHGLGVYALNVTQRQTFGNAYARTINYFFVGTRRRHRGMFLKDYYSCFFPLTIAYLVGYGVGVYLAYLIFRNSSYLPSFMPTFGILVGFIMTVFFLPYFYSVTGDMRSLYAGYFHEFSLEAAERELEQMRLSGQFTEDEIAQARDQLRKTRERLENEDHKDDEPPEDPYQ